MSISRIATRYAKSLMDLSIETNMVDPVMEDISALNQALQSRDFYMLLKSPVIPSGKKAEIFEAIFKGKVQDITYKFFMLVIRKGRETLFVEIIQEYITQYQKLKNIVPVLVTSAVALADNDMESIRKRLIDTGTLTGTLQMKNVVNPDIIGGFQIEFQDKLIDASIAHKLDIMKRELNINLYESKIRSL
jgi:F-type H+-transporting ATPase subunit delta